MQNVVIITGASGGIGSSLCTHFRENGWFVVGTSRTKPAAASSCDAFFQQDLDLLATDPEALSGFTKKVHEAIDGRPIKSLINNAAIQILGKTQDLTAQDLTLSFNVNVIAPFLLTQAFLKSLVSNKGNVLNIGSVHAQATKSDFVAYATSKTAIHGLTRALAVDLGPDIRVNTLAPAATATPMLKAGFEGKDAAYAALASAHPLGRISDVSEVAKAALFLCSDNASFMTGSTIYTDGGVLSRLHDPD